jgi:porin
MAIAECRLELTKTVLTRSAVVGVAVFGMICGLTVPSVADEAKGTAVPGQLDNGLVSLTKTVPHITPVFDYSGDIWDRGAALGDLFGERQNLYDKGFTFDAQVTQVVEGIASGGPEGSPDARYFGLADYGITLDTAKLGLWSGGLITANMQSSWGDSLFGETANASGVNALSLYPKIGETDTVLMEYYLTQALPGHSELVIGRINGTNFLDRNRLANNPRNQFLNTSFMTNPLFGAFLSFSTYAAVLVLPVTDQFTAAFTTWDPNDHPGDYGSTNGFFDEIGLGTQLEYRWAPDNNLDGTVRFALMYSSEDTTDFGNPHLAVDLITGQQPDQKSDNYIAHVNIEQYFWKPDRPSTGAKPVRTADDHFQEPGVGVFLRASMVPGDRNFYEAYVSGGISGRGFFPSRPHDRFGVGLYWLKESEELDSQPGNILEDEVGVEAFYNFAITPWAGLSAHAQWIDNTAVGVDDTVVLSSRLSVRF